MVHEKTKEFLNEIDTIDWFAHSGRPNEKYHMLFSLYEACDTWGKQYLQLWEPQICALEAVAVERIGDDTINEIFLTVSAAIGDIVWEKFGEYIERQHLGEELGVSYELHDMIKRDMAWACVERILEMSGFFTMLTEIYKPVYFPCSWDGPYPSCQAVVL